MGAETLQVDEKPHTTVTMKELLEQIVAKMAVAQNLNLRIVEHINGQEKVNGIPHFYHQASVNLGKDQIFMEWTLVPRDEYDPEVLYRDLMVQIVKEGLFTTATQWQKSRTT